jgi:hypothetical protein
VLVVGPTRVLAYIAGLPSLGETERRQTTLDRLLAGTAYRVRGQDSERGAAVKGDARQATVVAAAVAGARRPPDEDVAVATAWGGVRVAAPDLADLVKEVAARDVPTTSAGPRSAAGRPAGAGGAGPAPGRRDRPGRGAGERTAGPTAEWSRALDRPGPRSPPPTSCAGWSRTGPPWPPPRTACWTGTSRRPCSGAPRPGWRTSPGPAADLALLDEAEAAIGGPPRSYGHIVVDEAQDLSAMGLRALARRSRTRR